MNIASHYAKSFYSDKLTRHKYDEMLALAHKLRDVRNQLSNVVSLDQLFYLELSGNDFQKTMLPLIKESVHSNFTKQACDDVYTAYQNRFEQIKERMRFLGSIRIEYERYRRDTHKHKKGDLKERIKTSSSSSLSKVLSYLARYGNENTLAFVQSQLEKEITASKIRFYRTVIAMIDKFGLERLLAVAIMRRKNTLKRYSRAIEFKSLNFRGRSRISRDIVSINKNKRSVIKAFVDIGWLARGESKAIPVRYSYAWHGRDLEKYTNGTDTSYTVCFVERFKQIRFILSHEGERQYKDVDVEQDKFIGFDVNSKHGQISGSQLGIETDHYRHALDKLIVELQRIDDLKSKNDSYFVGKRRQNKIDALRRSVVSHTQQNCSSICKAMLAHGYNHAVFENLNKGFGKTRVTTKADFNYNRLITEMRLSSIKDEFERIARNGKHDKQGSLIATSFVHAEYTSQECSHCHYIDEDNRKTQEKFKCLSCGHEENADSNAARSIEQRVSEAVQRNLLEAEQKLGGAFRPKALHRRKVKEQLLAFRDARLDREQMAKSLC